MPVKECLTTESVDPKVLEVSGRTDLVVITMGLCWNVRQDTCTPSMYLTRYEKKRGKPLGVPLIEDWTLEISHNTRLVLSRLVPQLFDPLGGHMGPIKAQGKMLLSRGCQIAGAHQMKVPFIELDQTFGQQAFDWIQELRRIGKL